MISSIWGSNLTQSINSCQFNQVDKYLQSFNVYLYTVCLPKMEVTADLFAEKNELVLIFFLYSCLAENEEEETKEYLSLMGVDPEPPRSPPEPSNPEAPWTRPDGLSCNYSNSNYGNIITLRVPMAIAESDCEPEEEEEEEEEEDLSEVRYYHRVAGWFCSSSY